MSNWTGVDGVDPRPYATAIKYFCRRKGWGYPTTGENETTIYCRWDGTWSNDANIESCISKTLPHCHNATAFWTFLCMKVTLMP